MEICSSGSPWGFSGSRSSVQSIRSLAFHWRFLPFSYRLRSDCRPSAYSQRSTDSNPAGIVHPVSETGIA